MIFTTGGAAFGAISARSRPASWAMSLAWSSDTMPSWLPSSPTSRTEAALISLFRRGLLIGLSLRLREQSYQIWALWSIPRGGALFWFCAPEDRMKNGFRSRVVFCKMILIISFTANKVGYTAGFSTIKRTRRSVRRMVRGVRAIILPSIATLIGGIASSVIFLP